MSTQGRRPTREVKMDEEEEVLQRLQSVKSYLISIFYDVDFMFAFMWGICKSGDGYRGSLAWSCSCSVVTLKRPCLSVVLWVRTATLFYGEATAVDKTKTQHRVKDTTMHYGKFCAWCSPLALQCVITQRPTREFRRGRRRHWLYAQKELIMIRILSSLMITWRSPLWSTNVSLCTDKVSSCWLICG